MWPEENEAVLVLGTAYMQSGKDKGHFSLEAMQAAYRALRAHMES